MEIKQFRYSQNNLSYLLYNSKKAIVIDGGAVNDILSYTNNNLIEIKHITNTHNHYDHTQGTDILLKKTGAEYLTNKYLLKNKSINLENEVINIYHTPGHTLDSVIFHFNKYLISGDTLFNGTIGNCYSGEMESYFKSLKFILSLPLDTIIYPGHDLIKYALGVAANMDPDNININTFLNNYNPENVSSTLKEELLINPFIRFNNTYFIRMLKNKNLPYSSEYDRWRSLMTMH